MTEKKLKRKKARKIEKEKEKKWGRKKGGKVWSERMEAKHVERGSSLNIKSIKDDQLKQEKDIEIETKKRKTWIKIIWTRHYLKEYFIKDKLWRIWNGKENKRKGAGQNKKIKIKR